MAIGDIPIYSIIPTKNNGVNCSGFKIETPPIINSSPAMSYPPFESSSLLFPINYVPDFFSFSVV